ncbi:MAG: 50S ribosomal protein L9 [Deltaproteobacteria bacterium]|nr:50S ribosomal protein L9 [Deltaproteobacteria bacterium]
MKVILKQDMDVLGLEGDTVNVANGYARNYLIPKGFALEANNQNIKMMGLQRKKIEIKRLKAKEDAEKIKAQLADMVINISQKAGAEDKLYGSVTSMDIAAYMDKQGMSIDRRKISMERPIKTVGEFDVPIKLYPEVTGSIKVIVSPEESEE